MIDAAKRKSISPPGLTALWTILLLVVTLCLGQTRVWGFEITPQPASGIFAPANPLSIGENYDGCPYDVSDSLLAAKTPSTALSTFRQTTAGESFLHYGYAEQSAGFAGGLRPGGFATTASGLTGAEARAGLALPRAVPPNAVYTVTPTAGTTIRVNPVTSPQFGQPGGLPEFQFPLGTGPGTISNPRPIP